MKIKPGDLFEWVYKRDKSPVREGEELFSFAMGNWVSCSGVCLCVGVNDAIIYWISDNRLYFVGDNAGKWRAATRLKITSAIARKI